MLFKFLFYTVLAYFIFRWLDRIFSVKRPAQGRKKTPDMGSREKRSRVNKNVGEYVKYEELNKDK
jgi:hypothetical protein